MIIQNLELLKSWLTWKLEPICDADPAALAKYVAALVKKDKTESELVDVCIDQLEVFLGDKTIAFVNTLFEALKSSSYLSFGQNATANKESAAKVETLISKKESTDVATKDKKPSNDQEDAKDTQVIIDVSVSSTLTAADSSVQETSSDDRPKTDSNNTIQYARKRQNSDNLGKQTHDSSPSNSQGADRELGRSKHTKKDFKDANDSLPDGVKQQAKELDGKGSWGDKEVIKDGRDGRHNRPKFNSSPRYSPSPDRHKRRYQHKSREHREHRNDYRDRRSKEEEKGAVRKRGRCKDYEEKGYCIFGESCPYDHGKDPVIVNDINFGMDLFVPPNVNPHLPVPPQLPGVFPRMIPNSSALLLAASPLQPPLGSSATLNFNTGVNLALGQLRPVPSPLELPPRMPYFPPRLPAPIGNARHHQKDPSTDKDPVNASEAYNPEQPLIKLEEKGKPAPVWSRLGSAKDDVTAARSSEVLAQRELVGLPGPARTSTPAIRGITDTQPVYVPAPISTAKPAPYQRRPFQNQTILEIRKVPQALNTIVKLSEYFQKFGKIVNVQVKFDNDPEAALVQFESNAEARRAYTCPEAVFGNRFIKTFWHKGHFNSAGSQRTYPPSSSTAVSSRPTESTNQSELPRNSIAGTTFGKRPHEDSAPITTKYPHTTATKSINHQASLKLRNDNQKEAMKKRLEIQKQRHILLEKQIQEQKTLISRLEKGKKTSASEKSELLKAIKAITANVEKLKKEIQEEAKATHPKTKQTIEKELLDYEMDLFHKMQNGEDGNETRQRIDELRQEAKALGIRPKFSQSQIRGVGRGRRRSASSFGQPQSSQSNATVDHRPRQLLVTGFDASDKEAVINNFKELGDMERLEDRDGGRLIIVFPTRKQAEMAVAKASTFPGKKLTLAWYLGNLQSTTSSVSKSNVTSSSSSDPGPPPAKILRSMSRASVSSTLSKEDESDLLLDVDEKEELLLLSEMDEDEEEDEERSWRR